jgi:hypothetical protein
VAHREQLGKAMSQRVLALMQTTQDPADGHANFGFRPTVTNMAGSLLVLDSVREALKGLRGRVTVFESFATEWTDEPLQRRLGVALLSGNPFSL